MVMCEGSSTETLNISEATEEKIMALATGVTYSENNQTNKNEVLQ
jgi:hypothetical protein